MTEDMVNELLWVCGILDECSVKYLVIGGTAVGIHGYSRHTILANGDIAEKQDVDFWYDSSYENYFNLLNAMEKLGEDVSEIRNDPSPDPRNSFFGFELEKITIDFLPKILGLEKFHISYMNRKTIQVMGKEIQVLNYEDLVINKEATNRQKDIDDLNELKKFH